MDAETTILVLTNSKKTIYVGKSGSLKYDMQSKLSFRIE